MAGPLDVLIGLLGISVVMSLGIGRFGVPLEHVLGIILDGFISIEPTWKPVEERVVELIRMPRILIAGLAGAGLLLPAPHCRGFPQPAGWTTDHWCFIWRGLWWGIRHSHL